MPQFKAFTSAYSVDDVARMERSVNEWLEREQPRILFVNQSPFGENMVLSFIYEAYLADYAVAEVAVEETVDVPEVFERTLGDADLDPSEETDEHIDLPLPEAELPY